MLNLYKYYDDAKSLPMYTELNNKIYMLLKPNRTSWGTSISAEELEPIIQIIKRSPIYAYDYAKNIIKGRWPEGESVIKRRPYEAYQYSLYMLRLDPHWQYKSGRWPDAEPYIMKDSDMANSYAGDILAKEPTWPHKNGRWPDAEPIIKKNPYAAYDYAMRILKHRWLEAEPTIQQDEWLWGEYKHKLGIE